MDECATHNGGCSHSCVNMPGSFVCTCPTGHRLNSDRTTCQRTYVLSVAFYCCDQYQLANTRSPEAPAAPVGHPSPCLATPSHCQCLLCAQPAHGPARLHVYQPLLSDECPPTCSTGSLAGSVPNMAITSVASTFSVTFCR